jgi:hypothetical protein
LSLALGGPLRIGGRKSIGTRREIEYLREMQRPAIRGVLDLCPTTEAVGNDDCARVGFADRRQQDTLAARHREVVVSALEAERSGQTAAPRIENVDA